MALIGKDGKPLNTTGVDEGVVTLLEAALDGQAVTTATAVKTQISEALDPISEKLDGISGLGEKLTELEAKVGKAGESKPGEEKPGKDDKTKPGDEVMETLKGLVEKVDTLTSERESEKNRSAAETRVDAWLKQHRPNLSDTARARVRARAVAASPEDDKAVESVVKEVQAEWKDAGVKDVDAIFSADPAKEGGKAGEGDDSAEAKKAKTMEAIKERKPGSF